MDGGLVKKVLQLEQGASQIDSNSVFSSFCFILHTREEKHLWFDTISVPTMQTVNDYYKYFIFREPCKHVDHVYTFVLLYNCYII